MEAAFGSLFFCNPILYSYEKILCASATGKDKRLHRKNGLWYP